MRKVKEILLVKSGNHADRSLVARTAALALNLDGNLTLAEVMPDYDQVADIFRQARLRELATLLPNGHQGSVRYRLLAGTLASAVAGVAPEFDLVVLADDRDDSSHNREIAELLRTVSVPTWLDGGEGEETPRRILAAVDVTTADPRKRQLNRPILQHALELASLFGAELDVLSVFRSPGAAERLATRLGAGPSPTLGDGSELERQLRALVEEVRTDFESSPRPRLIVAGGTASELLAHGIDAASVDLLVAGHLGRRGLAAWIFGNTVETLREELDCSILAITKSAIEDGNLGKSERDRAA